MRVNESYETTVRDEHMFLDLKRVSNARLVRLLNFVSPGLLSEINGDANDKCPACLSAVPRRARARARVVIRSKCKAQRWRTSSSCHNTQSLRFVPRIASIAICFFLVSLFLPFSVFVFSRSRCAQMRQKEKGRETERDTSILERVELGESYGATRTEGEPIRSLISARFDKLIDIKVDKE